MRREYEKITREKDVLRIIHISDLHFMEDVVMEFLRPKVVFHGAEGASLNRLRELTNRLNTLDFDLLLITGDYTVIGTEKSYKLVKNWIEGRITAKDINPSADESKFGLELDKSQYRTIPGNHDYFHDGKTVQYSSEYYYEYFPLDKKKKDDEEMLFNKPCEMEVEHIEIIKKNKVRIILHKFDSSKLGSNAQGEIINSKIDYSKNIKHTDCINIAMLHHHCVYPYNLLYEDHIALTNSKEVVDNFLATHKHVHPENKIDAILFGHTHIGYLNYHAPDEVKRMVYTEENKEHFNHYRKVAFTKENIKKNDDGVIISMAASACNAGTKVCGFNVIDYNTSSKSFNLKQFFYDNTGFVEWDEKNDIIPIS